MSDYIQKSIMIKKITILLMVVLTACSAPKSCCSQDLQSLLKFSTFYAAVNGGTSLSDVDVFSVDNGLSTSTISTPYDYNLTVGLRKIARFGYENKAQTFYDGTESNYTDAATVGKVQGFEYLFVIDYARQQGIDYIDRYYLYPYFGGQKTAPHDIKIKIKEWKNLLYYF